MSGLDFAPVWAEFDTLLSAVRFSLLAAIAGFVLALLGGLAAVLARRSRVKPLAWLAFAYTAIFRGAALYVLLVWLYFGVAISVGITLTALTAGIVALGLLNSAYLSEVFRSAIDAVDPGQTEAALAMGLTRGQVFRSVVAPQALRIALPATGNHFVDAVKDSAILSVIAVPELMFQTSRLANANFAPFEFYTVASGIYLVLVLVVAAGIRLLERRLAVERRPTSVALQAGLAPSRI